jgi:E3 ubiquitin-protein ligase TRIP12
VRRAQLFDDGCVLLQKFLGHRLSVEIQFDGETGIGIGPTREFFALMSREFAASRLRLFRNDRPDGPYCFTPLGLFPDPEADWRLFRMLGTLVAKAVSLEVTLELDFNPAFFDLARGKKVDVGRVDRHLASALAAPSGLFGLEFGDGDEVDESNVARFVEDAAINGNVGTCAEEFVRGFNEVMPFGMLEMFAADEICQIIRGDGRLITEEDLVNFVEISHGYTKESPQIEMLYEIVTAMDTDEQRDFVCFVTGSHNLPVGGLRGLVPRMTVMRRNCEYDGDLPTASTCMYLLKLPPYAEKGVMERKLKMAISEGLNAFDLS